MDDSGSPMLIGFIIYICFIILDAMLFGFGAAIQSVSDSALEGKERESGKAERIRYWKDNPDDLINTIQIISNLLCLLTGSIVVHTVSAQWHQALTHTELARYLPSEVIYALTACLAIFLFLLFLYPIGIHVPKLLGKKNARNWCFGLVDIVDKIVRISSPVTKLILLFAHLLLKILGIPPEKFQEDVTEEEIISMVNEGHEQGMLEAKEAEMINNIFEFGDKDAQDIMTHRKNIVAVNGMQQFSTALEFMLNATNSRFPVYEGDIDNVTGIIHLKDAMKCHTSGGYEDWLVKDIPDLIRPAVFIPETRKINLLFKSMQSKKLQMVMVADEYGQTAGLVALEDILEEIVGNIQDEYDVEENMIERLSEHTFIMDGMAALDEVEESLGTELYVEEDIETLNGYLISKLEKIPAEDEHSTIEACGWKFEILSVAQKTIHKVRVTKISEAETKTQQQVEEGA